MISKAALLAVILLQPQLRWSARDVIGLASNFRLMVCLLACEP
jgi:hypothetical protein